MTLGPLRTIRQTVRRVSEERLRTLLVDDVEDFRVLLRVLMEQDGRFDVVGRVADLGNRRHRGLLGTI